MIARRAENAGEKVDFVILFFFATHDEPAFVALTGYAEHTLSLHGLASNRQKE